MDVVKRFGLFDIDIAWSWTPYLIMFDAVSLLLSVPNITSFILIFFCDDCSSLAEYFVISGMRNGIALLLVGTTVFATLSLRTIIIGISTLVALPAYRNAMINFLLYIVQRKKSSHQRRDTTTAINTNTDMTVARRRNGHPQ
ncbi:hypothetical protein Tcan_07703 [Toxocara canis]|uniref:Transmembrane protein n=1 Tax=Toxocara canis TaxID=6265 RepID=A0A0B2UUZ9_TOXCA|nr:hypothetical protein Tcan_07703 [Toxocara canis]